MIVIVGLLISLLAQSDDESPIGQKRFFKPLFVDVWTDAAASFARAYASTGTLLEDRALDSQPRERDDDDDEQRRYGDTPRLFFTQYFCFLFVRALYFRPLNADNDVVHDKTAVPVAVSTTTAAAAADDANASQHDTRLRTYTFECLNLLVFPLVLLVDVCAIALWWLLALPSVPLFLLLFVLTGGCCHTRWSMRRVRHYYCLTLAAIVYVVAIVGAVVIGVYSWSILGAFVAIVVTYLYGRVIIAVNK